MPAFYPLRASIIVFLHRTAFFLFVAVVVVVLFIHAVVVLSAVCCCCWHASGRCFGVRFCFVVFVVVISVVVVDAFLCILAFRVMESEMV